MKADDLPIFASMCVRNRIKRICNPLFPASPFVAITQRMTDTIIVTIWTENSVYKVNFFCVASFLTLERRAKGMAMTVVVISRANIESGYTH